MTHVTCRLTAKNRDQLRIPALGNRVRATFFTCSSDRQSLGHQSSGQVSPEEASSRRGSTPSDTASIFPPPHLYASNPDLTSLVGSAAEDSSGSGTLVGRRRRDVAAEQVLKIYRADQTSRYVVVHRVRHSLSSGMNLSPVMFFYCWRPVWARERCRMSPPRFLAECCKRQLNQGSFVSLYFRLSTFSDLY